MRRTTVTAWLLGTLLALAVLAWPGNAAAESADDLVIFTNKHVEATAVSVDELRHIFLKRKTTWPGGRRIVCVNALEGSRARQAFRKGVLRMTAEQERRYWQEQKIKGKAGEPSSFSNTVKAVFRLKGGVGYAFRRDVKGDVVRVVLTIPAQ